MTEFEKKKNPILAATYGAVQQPIWLGVEGHTFNAFKYQQSIVELLTTFPRSHKGSAQLSSNQ